jgi:hypothetical protein
VALFAGGEPPITNISYAVIRNATEEVDIFYLFNGSSGTHGTATLSEARRKLAATSVGSLATTSSPEV